MRKCDTTCLCVKIFLSSEFDNFHGLVLNKQKSVQFFLQNLDKTLNQTCKKKSKTEKTHVFIFFLKNLEKL